MNVKYNIAESYLKSEKSQISQKGEVTDPGDTGSMLVAIK